MTAPWNPQEAVVGAPVAALISLLPFSLASPLGDLRLNPKALASLLTYGFVFSKALVLSNLDVAFRVLHPRLPIDPGIVKVKTKLKTPLGRLLLANSITLTPGTITVELRGEDMYIHGIKVADLDPEAATAAIVGDFERYLEVKPVAVSGTGADPGGAQESAGAAARATFVWNLAEMVQKEPGKRPVPEPIPGAVVEKTYDSIIAAIGQGPDLSYVNETDGIELKRYKPVISPDGRTSRATVFAGGDLTNDRKDAISAIADGHRAALAMDRLLAGKEA